MEVARRLFSRLWHWEYAGLLLIVIVTVAIHFTFINTPNQPLFDEQHYVPDARVILQQHSTNRTEHPPLSKLLVAGGMMAFGDNPYGWRIPSIIFGTAAIVFFFLVCRQLNMPRKAAYAATFLLAFENLTFVQSSIAMLDVFMLTFTIMAFWLYLRRSYPLAMVAVALATLCKLSGLLAAAPIILHWVLVRRDQRWIFGASIILSALSFLLLFAAFEMAIYRRMIDYVSAINTMLSGTASLTFANTVHPSLSRPWLWMYWPPWELPVAMPYYWTPHYLGVVSFGVWGLGIPAVAYMVWKAIKKNAAAIFGLLWFFGTYLLWIPLNLITDRDTYIFYFLPTIGALCIGETLILYDLVSWWWAKRSSKRRWPAVVFAGLFLALHVAMFVIVSPVNSWRIDLWFR